MQAKADTSARQRLAGCNTRADGAIFRWITGMFQNGVPTPLGERLQTLPPTSIDDEGTPECPNHRHRRRRGPGIV